MKPLTWQLAGVTLITAFAAGLLASPQNLLVTAAAALAGAGLVALLAERALVAQEQAAARQQREDAAKLRALDASRQWSEALIHSVVEGIVTCEADGRIVFFSAGAERITGWERTAALGQSLDDVLPLTTEEGGHITDYVPADGGRRTVLVRHHGGSPITLALTRANPVQAGQMTIVLRDITEETRRRKAQTYFLANMSHEFRTPLAGMSASVELMRENLGDLSLDETRELLDSIHLSLTMLQQLIDNLLESSKLEANHFVLNRRACEVEPLMGEAIRLVEPMFARRDQRLTYAEPLSLPTLWVDPTRAKQVLVNLLSNASKYSPVGSIIDVAVEQDGNQVKLCIADRGRGVESEMRGSIFLPFVRLEPESQADHGSGIGLSVVRAITEAHLGQAGVETRDGGGSVFWVTLPVAATAGDTGN